MARRSDELADTQGTVDIDRDRALVLRCQEGDATAFAELYTRYYERLLRFCRRRLGDSAEAEDMAQEAFVKAWRALPRFEGERRFYPWLTVIAGNLCTDVLRKRSRTVSEPDGDLDARRVVQADTEVTPEERVVAAADGELAQRALQRLTTRHRRVLVLREGSELTYQQIAAREGLDVSAVETLLWRARQALKREFTELSGSGAMSAVVGFGMVGVLRRATARVGQAAAFAGRRMATFRFGGVPVREAAVALVLTSAAVTAGAQFLQGPSAARVAHPAHPTSSVPALTGRAADGSADTPTSARVAAARAPVAPPAGGPTVAGSGTTSETTTGGAASGGAGTAGVSPSGSPSPLPVPAAPSLPSLPAVSPPKGLAGVVTSVLPPVSPSAPTTAVPGAVATVTKTVGAVGQALSSTAGSAASALPSPLKGLLGGGASGG